jgi:hypothetical protein
MSMDACGPADVYKNVRRKASKAHACSACRDTIPAGHQYHAITIVDDGDVYTYKRCLRCEQIHAHLAARCRALKDWSHHWPDEELNCGHSYEERWGEAPPEEIAALAFVTPEEMQSRRQP